MRSLSAAQLTEIAASATAAVSLVELDFSGGVARFSTGDRDLLIDGDTYTATGTLGNIGAISEDRSVTSPGLKLTLSGIDTSVITAALNEQYYNRSALIYWLFIDAAGEPIGDPLLTWAGFMDTMQISSDRQSLSIELMCESRAIQSKNRPTLRTQEAQQALFPGDTFYNFLTGLEGLSVNWGGKPVDAARPEPPVTGGAVK